MNTGEEKLPEGKVENVIGVTESITQRGGREEELSKGRIYRK